MRSPNHFSFRNFSRRKRKSFILPLIFGGIGLIGFSIIAAILWNHQKSPSRITSTVTPLITTLAKEQKEKKIPALSDEYMDFDKPVEQDGLASPDIEEENDHLMEKDSDLVQIFKTQEKEKKFDFIDESLWQKNAHKPLKIFSSQKQVVVIIEGIESLSSADWQQIQKLNIPLTFVFQETHPHARALAQKSWQKRREILVRPVSFKFQSLDKKFSKMVGIVTTSSPKLSSYLTLSPIKGLKEGKDHQIFSFPLVREKKAFSKSKRSILWVTYNRSAHMRSLVEWVHQHKKEINFIYLSQLYKTLSSNRKIIEVKKIQSGYSNLA